jgi:hypothetical protein
MPRPARFTGVSDEKINEALQSQAVRNALARRGARALPTARALAYRSGAASFAQALRMSEGTRSGAGARGNLKRTYVRIGAVVTPEMRREDRGASLSRRQILRRASNG